MTPPVAFVLDAALVLILLAMAVAAWRVLRGPTQADRVIALDVLIIAAVAVVAIGAWQTGTAALLDVALAVALVTFLGAVALAWYLEQRGEP